MAPFISPIGSAVSSKRDSYCPSTQLTSAETSPTSTSTPSIFPVFSCPKCDRAFSTRDRRNLHIEYEHSGLGKFQCQTEGFNKEYSRLDNLLNHHRAKHPRAEAEHGEEPSSSIAEAGRPTEHVNSPSNGGSTYRASYVHGGTPLTEPATNEIPTLGSYSEPPSSNVLQPEPTSFRSAWFPPIHNYNERHHPDPLGLDPPQEYRLQPISSPIQSHLPGNMSSKKRARQGPLTADSRIKARTVRAIGACWRCKIYKVTVRSTRPHSCRLADVNS